MRYFAILLLLILFTGCTQNLTGEKSMQVVETNQIPTDNSLVPAAQNPEVFSTIQPANSRIVSFYVYANGNRIAKKENKVLSYYHADQLGSVRAITNDAGAVLERQDYTPYGSDLHGSKLNNEFAYTGQYDDGDLYYYGARYMDTFGSRFTSPDPLGSADAGFYSYVNNNPLAFIDPDGRKIQFSQLEGNKASSPLDSAASKTAIAIISEINKMFGDDVLSMGDNGYLALEDRNFDTEKGEIYDLLKSAITDEKTISVEVLPGMGNWASPEEYKVIMDPNFGGWAERYDIYPMVNGKAAMGKGGSLIADPDNLGVAFIHETKHEVDFVNGGKSSETAAMQYENKARALLGLEPKSYYAPVRIWKGKKLVGWGLIAPEHWDAIDTYDERGEKSVASPEEFDKIIKVQDLTPRGYH
jgi:RHS repeat-associated protein